MKKYSAILVMASICHLCIAQQSGPGFINGQYHPEYHNNTYTPTKDRPLAPSSTPSNNNSYYRSTTPADNTPAYKPEPKPEPKAFVAAPVPQNGYAEYSYSEELKYKGNFKDGQRSGTGTFSNKGRALYEGEWANDVYNGKGILHLGHGDDYEGNFMNGERSGHGILSTMDDVYRITYYEGEWKNGQLQGQVTISSNKEKYTGGYSNNMKNGKGTLTILLHGDKYEGIWTDDRLNGPGTYYNGVTEATYTGNLINGNPNGKGVMVSAGGSREEGDWVDGELNGQGIWTVPNGVRYEGGWVAGRMSGHGIWTNGKDESYEGEFSQGRRNGYGVYDSSGVKYEGQWFDGIKAPRHETPNSNQVMDDNTPVLLDLKNIMESATTGFANAKGKRIAKQGNDKDDEKRYNSLFKISCAVNNGIITSATVYEAGTFSQFKEEISFRNTSDRDNYLQKLGSVLPAGTKMGEYGWEEASMEYHTDILLKFNAFTSTGVTIAIQCLHCWEGMPGR